MLNHLATFGSETSSGGALHLRNGLTAKRILATGNLAAGAILGSILGTATPAAVAGNTGDGAFGAVTLGANAKKGVYRVVIVEPASDAGAFIVEDPDGIQVGHGTVGVAFAGPINFTLADGAANFIAGDSFTVTVALDEDGSVKLSAAAATDGSQIPECILAEAADASDDPVECLVYTRGDFMESGVTYGAGHTAATVEAALRARDIYLIPAAR